MKLQNKYILIGILLFPFILGMYIGEILSRVGEWIYKVSEKYFDKYGEKIVEKLNLEEKE